ncbi:predicted protein [Sclerotinia sclerotiorum 1980 UF-70]|uniref:Uncharacterized protein n=1 Tax=Sclerotinia sclerotiorum (strain ATCC 18683 / 1980 / Ss-1) TaxID=665079 RepID=A7E513_SCLS1|nr:predicted protein [Sclerotinia sclerotiorum 1980 UF-70]EDN90985.1 predicted protein [Sclerotinia sclerotiorum 1980 UF-70]
MTMESLEHAGNSLRNLWLLCSNKDEFALKLLNFESFHTWLPRETLPHKPEYREEVQFLLVAMSSDCHAAPNVQQLRDRIYAFNLYEYNAASKS